MAISHRATINHTTRLSQSLLFTPKLSHHSPPPPPPPPLPPPPPQLLTKDWLSPSQTLALFAALPSHALISSLSHLAARRDYKPNEPLFSLIVSNLGRSLDFDDIDELLPYLIECKPCRLSDEFFHGLIKVYGNQGGKINRAVEVLLDIMPQFKCCPSERTFNCVLNLLVNTRQLDMIGRVYGKARELGVTVDACCLNIMIKGLCKDGRFEDAYKVFEEFPEQGCERNVRTYCELMHGLCEHGRVDEAFSWLDRMERDGVSPDTITFNVLISGLCKNGRVDDAVKMLDRMMRKGCEPNKGSYQQVLYGLLKSGKFVMARKFMEQMIRKRYTPSFESYKLMLIGLCDEKMVEDVNWLLVNMVRHGLKPRMGMWKKIVEATLVVNCSFGCSLMDELVK